MEKQNEIKKENKRKIVFRIMLLTAEIITVVLVVGVISLLLGLTGFSEQTTKGVLKVIVIFFRSFVLADVLVRIKIRDFTDHLDKKEIKTIIVSACILMIIGLLTAILGFVWSLRIMRTFVEAAGILVVWYVICRCHVGIINS